MSKRGMLTRFALYGLFKNQRYFEPFLVLAFLDKGLSFFLIGLLVGFRELIVNLLEIPSGVIADVLGRRRVLVLAHLSYVVGFSLLGVGEHLALLFAGMFAFAIGESFRTGTHKAMIFDWLKREQRTDEKTQVYGYTRSWSKTGSAISVILAAGIVLLTRNYEYTFYLCVIPYTLGAINLLLYPVYLESQQSAKLSTTELFNHFRQSLRIARTDHRMRRLVLQSMGFEGVFHSVKDYLQPVLLAIAVPLAADVVLMADLAEPQKVAILAAPVYFLLHVCSAIASRNAHRVADAAGSEFQAIRWIWSAALCVFVVMAVCGYIDVLLPMMIAFIVLFILHNLWRPIQIGRFEKYGQSIQGATLLSMESQARRLATMFAAPLIGLAIDAASGLEHAGSLWPIGLFGLFVGIVLFPRPSGNESGNT